MGDSVGHWEGDTLVVETTQLPSRADVPRLVGEHGRDRAVHARRRRQDRLSLHGRRSERRSPRSSPASCRSCRWMRTSTSTPATRATTHCRASSPASARPKKAAISQARVPRSDHDVAAAGLSALGPQSRRLCCARARQAAAASERRRNPRIRIERAQAHVGVRRSTCPTATTARGLHYPVMYLLHGNNGTLNDWAALGRIQRTADGLIAAGEIPPAIIVMPDAGSTWYVDRKENMETAVIRDLIARRREEFSRGVATREGRVVGGLSMGGYGALRFALKYPDKFAAAALLSPAIYEPVPPENVRCAPRRCVRRSAVRSRRTGRATTIRRSGTRSWRARYACRCTSPRGDDDEFYIEEEAARFYSLLRRNGQPAELRIANGAHVWPCGKRGSAMRCATSSGIRRGRSRNSPRRSPANRAEFSRREPGAGLAPFRGSSLSRTTP